MTRHGWVHRKVWLAWGRGWAAQYYRMPCASLGVHLDPSRPLLDMHATPLTPLLLVGVALGLPAWTLLLSLLPIGVLTVSIGAEPHITEQRDRHRQSCRGFLFTDDPVL